MAEWLAFFAGSKLKKVSVTGGAAVTLCDAPDNRGGTWTDDDTISDGEQRDVWVYEWARDTLTQLTFDPGEDRYPVWTPDGRRLVFASDRGTDLTLNLYLVNADGTGDVTRLTDSPETQLPWSWHPSGKFLALHTRRAAATAGDLMILPMEGDAARGWTPGTPTVILSTPVNEVVPMFSPDGRWIA